MKYKATITGLGECALDFLDECCNFIIIFNEDAPPELADISVLHTKSEVREDPKKGDTVRICGVEYTIADAEMCIRDSVFPAPAYEILRASNNPPPAYRVSTSQAASVFLHKSESAPDSAPSV